MSENKGGIPEKIKLGDKEFVVKDHPELLELLQKARKEEKDKLYSQISSFETKIKVLEDEKKTNGELSVAKEEKLKALQDELAVAKAEKEKLEKTKGGGKGKPDPDDDDEEDDDEPKGKKSKSKAVANGISKEDMADMLKTALEEQQKVFDKRLEEVKGGLNKKTVGDYRKEQLAKYKGFIIEDLVREDLDSEEAVNKAIEQALEKSKPYIQKEYEVDGKKQRMTIAEYEEYEKSQKEKGNDGKGTGNYTPPTPPDRPDGGSGNLTGKELLSRIEDMSDEEYAKHADQILKEVKSVKYQDS